MQDHVHMAGQYLDWNQKAASQLPDLLKNINSPTIQYIYRHN